LKRNGESASNVTMSFIASWRYRQILRETRVHRTPTRRRSRQGGGHVMRPARIEYIGGSAGTLEAILESDATLQQPRVRRDPDQSRKDAIKGKLFTQILNRSVRGDASRELAFQRRFKRSDSGVSAVRHADRASSMR
jgi:hypothetical protein